MAKRFFLFFVTIGLICSLAGLSACKSPSSPSGGNPQPVKYTVVFMNGETKVGEQRYTANSVIDWSEITLTAQDGKEFAFWCTDLTKPEETKISEGYKVTSNITLYAYFKNAATPEETYTVKFVNDDGSLVGEEFKDKKAGAEITVPAEAPESVNNPGWKFSGWYLNGDDSKTPVSGKYTVKAEDAVDNVITIKAVFVDSSSAVSPDSISLEPVSATLEVGGSYILADVKVTYSPDGTNTQRDITWSIKTGNDFATLDGTLVTAVKEGEVVLTATTANGKTAEFTLTVNDSLQSISVTAAPATVQVGETSDLTVKAVYSSGEKELTAPDVVITVDPADAGTVTGGVFTAAKAGDAEITASYGGKTGMVTVTVTEEPVPDPVYTVKFVKDDGSTVVEAFTEKTAGTEITVPGETPVSTKGYDVFEGWYLNGDVSSPVTGTYTVKAEDVQEGVITIKAVYKQTVHVEKIVSGTDTNGATWFWIGGVKVFAFVTGGSYGDGLWVPVTNHVEVGEGVDPTNFDAKVVLYPDWEKFYLVRANSETTEPDLDKLEDGAGKIYNKTDDVNNPKTEGSPVAISTPIKVFDFVSPGYLEVRIDHIKDSVGIQTGEEENFMFYVAGSIGAESKDCWVKPVAVYDSVDGARFVLKVSDMNAGLGEGSSISLFILTELTNPSGESVWGNVAYQTDDMKYNPVESVYYPNQWKVHQ